MYVCLPIKLCGPPKLCLTLCLMPARERGSSLLVSGSVYQLLCFYPTKESSVGPSRVSFMRTNSLLFIIPLFVAGEGKTRELTVKWRCLVYFPQNKLAQQFQCTSKHACANRSWLSHMMFILFPLVFSARKPQTRQRLFNRFKLIISPLVLIVLINWIYLLSIIQAFCQIPLLTANMCVPSCVCVCEHT